MRNRTVGALFGYSSVNSKYSLAVRSSPSVSSGPNLAADACVDGVPTDCDYNCALILIPWFEDCSTLIGQLAGEQFGAYENAYNRCKQTDAPDLWMQIHNLQEQGCTVPLPAGVADGTKVRIPGKGSAGRRGGVVGDLYVTVVVQPHVVFRRDGDDLHLVVPVAVHEAALGARIDVPTVDNRARVRIPPGTQAGQRLRLRGRGVPSPRTGEPGDLIVEVRIVLPEVIDERVKQLLRDLAELSTEDVRARLWSEVTT